MVFEICATAQATNAAISTRLSRIVFIDNYYVLIQMVLSQALLIPVHVAAGREVPLVVTGRDNVWLISCLLRNNAARVRAACVHLVGLLRLPQAARRLLRMIMFPYSITPSFIVWVSNPRII